MLLEVFSAYSLWCQLSLLSICICCNAVHLHFGYSPRFSISFTSPKRSCNYLSVCSLVSFLLVGSCSIVSGYVHIKAPFQKLSPSILTLPEIGALCRVYVAGHRHCCKSGHVVTDKTQFRKRMWVCLRHRFHKSLFPPIQYKNANHGVFKLKTGSAAFSKVLVLGARKCSKA